MNKRIGIGEAGTLVLGTVLAVVSAAGFSAGKLFDSNVFPARGAWPMGQTVAATIEAGDKGGRKAVELVQGLAVGMPIHNTGMGLKTG